jgi:hypothetical protein
VSFSKSERIWFPFFITSLWYFTRKQRPTHPGRRTKKDARTVRSVRDPRRSLDQADNVRRVPYVFAEIHGLPAPSNIETALHLVISQLTMMMSASIVRKSSSLASRGLLKSNDVVRFAGIRSLSTTPRSAKTLDPNVDDDNILPVRVAPT